MIQETIESERLEGLVLQAVGGDRGVLGELVLGLWPHWLRLVKTHRLARSQQEAEDIALDVATTLAERLCHPDGRVLRLFFAWREKNQEKSFGDWVRISTINALRDHSRARLRRELGSRATPFVLEGVSYQGLLNEFSRFAHEVELGVRPPLTPVLLAVQLMTFAREHLSEPQIAVLERWLMGDEIQEIATSLSIEDPDHVRRLLRAGIAVLRRRFSGEAV